MALKARLVEDNARGAPADRAGNSSTRADGHGGTESVHEPRAPAAARYLGVPGAWVLPLGLTGSESLFLLDHSSPRRARVVARLGTPIEAAALVGRAAGDRRLVMDTLGLAIAETLPAPYRGVYGDAGGFPGAQAVLQELRG